MFQVLCPSALSQFLHKMHHLCCPKIFWERLFCFCLRVQGSSVLQRRLPRKNSNMTSTTDSSDAPQHAPSMWKLGSKQNGHEMTKSTPCAPITQPLRPKTHSLIFAHFLIRISCHLANLRDATNATRCCIPVLGLANTRALQATFGASDLSRFAAVPCLHAV